MESVETNNQVEYTKEEKDLATKYQVEPKLIRMIAEIVCEHTSEITEADNLIKGEKEQQAEPEQTEIQEQPAELSIDKQIQERITNYYKNLDPRTKLAIATLFELQSLDGLNFQFRDKEGRLMDKIWSDLESVCIETFHKEPDDTALGVIDSVAGIGKTNEDVWLCGVWEAVRMVIQNC